MYIYQPWFGVGAQDLGQRALHCSVRWQTVTRQGGGLRSRVHCPWQTPELLRKAHLGSWQLFFAEGAFLGHLKPSSWQVS